MISANIFQRSLLSTIFWLNCLFVSRIHESLTIYRLTWLQHRSRWCPWPKSLAMRPILKSIGLLLRLTTIAQQLGSTAAKYKISAIILSKFPQSAATQKYSNIYYWWTADNSCRSTMWKRVLWTGQCDMHSGGREREQSPDSRNSHSNNPFPFPVSQVSSVDRWPATWTELQNKSVQIVLERRTTICYSIKNLLCHSFYWQLDNFGIDR